MSNVVYHVSETRDLQRFEPRADGSGNAVVWAIDEIHVPNYWLPRDCPRVCVRRGRCEDQALISSILGAFEHVIYVEEAWRDRIRKGELFSYTFDASSFECVDVNAGYFQSRIDVVPLHVSTVSGIEAMMSAHAVSLRYVESLWPIAEAMTQSRFEFSAIRMRNAARHITPIV
jgi:hypothetical protein